MEETLSDLLEQEAYALAQAARYEHSEARQDCRSGHDNRDCNIKSEDAKLCNDEKCAFFRKF